MAAEDLAKDQLILFALARAKSLCAAAVEVPDFQQSFRAVQRRARSYRKLGSSRAGLWSG